MATAVPLSNFGQPFLFFLSLCMTSRPGPALPSGERLYEHKTYLRGERCALLC